MKSQKNLHSEVWEFQLGESGQRLFLSDTIVNVHGYLKEAESAPKLVTVPKVLSYIIYGSTRDN